jgi:ferredoxin
LLVAPVIVVAFWWLGTVLAVPLTQWHPESRLAEQIRLEELGVAEQTTDASDAFRGSGRSVDQLYQSAVTRRNEFVTLGGLLGAWTGLVIGFKLIHLSVRRRRDDYQADRAGCVSCGRCYWYCPVEKVRLGLINDVNEALPDGQIAQGRLVQLTTGGKKS